MPRQSHKLFFHALLALNLPFSHSETWVARCSNLQFQFDRSNKLAYLYLNTTIGLLQVAQGTISIDNGVLMRAPMSGNALSFNDLALTEVELNPSNKAVNVQYRSPIDGTVSSGKFCNTVISGVLMKSPSRRPTRKRSANPSRRITKSPSKKPTKQPIRKPTLRPSRKPTNKVQTTPTMQPSMTEISNKTFITPGTASELVIIPDPPKPLTLLGTNRTKCPHLGNLSDWHSSSTWGVSANIPTSGQNVTLPVNTRVLISKSINGTLGFIIIPSSSELVIGENVQGIQVHAKGFDVQGRLTAGSETCRIETSIAITLYGTRSNDVVTNIKPPLFKGIVVSGSGQLDLHGKRYFRTWTRL